MYNLVGASILSHNLEVTSFIVTPICVSSDIQEGKHRIKDDKEEHLHHCDGLVVLQPSKEVFPNFGPPLLIHILINLEDGGTQKSNKKNNDYVANQLHE